VTTNMPTAAGITSLSFLAASGVPTKVMFSHMVLRIEQHYPILRSKYIQVLLLAVCPLLLLLAAILIDLNFGRRVLVHDEETTFRPSLAVRCTWIFVIVALLGNALFSVGTRYIEIVGYFFAVFELIRTFPRSVTIGNDGIKWGTLWAQVRLPWEKVYCFVKKRSFLAGEEYKLHGTDGQTLVLSRMVRPNCEKIAQSIFCQLRARHLAPSGSEPQSALDVIHPLIALASAIVIVFGRYL
jgi:hypothetical protein